MPAMAAKSRHTCRPKPPEPGREGRLEPAFTCQLDPGQPTHSLAHRPVDYPEVGQGPDAPHQAHDGGEAGRGAKQGQRDVGRVRLIHAVSKPGYHPYPGDLSGQPRRRLFPYRLVRPTGNPEKFPATKRLADGLGEGRRHHSIGVGDDLTLLHIENHPSVAPGGLEGRQPSGQTVPVPSRHPVVQVEAQAI